MSVALLSFSFLVLPGLMILLLKILSTPLVSFLLLCAPRRSSDPQMSQSSWICCGRCRGCLVSGTCLCPRLCQFPSVGRAGPWAGFSPGPHPTPSSPRSPRWGWGRLRTSLASGIKVSSAVSFVPTPAPCSPWLLRWGGRAGTLPRGWN